MLKRLFIFFFYIVAITFSVFVALNHMELYKSMTHLSFSDWDNIKLSISSIILVLADLIVVLIVFFTFLGFLIHLLNSARGAKRMLKCVDTIGSYFVIYMVVTYIGMMISYIGNSGWVEYVKGLVTQKEFYLPLLLDVIAGIFLIVARAIKRGGIVTGIFVSLAVGLFFFVNIRYFNSTRVDLMSNLRFFTLLGCCALAVVPSFIPDINLVP